MNAEELQANRRLAAHLVHDLNRHPGLPLDNDSFDAVICTASVEYLTQPLEVFAEVARVTRPGGVVLMTFSDRWFSGKEIEPWGSLHPFERRGLVLECFRERSIFDPIFAVWGTVRS